MGTRGLCGIFSNQTTKATYNHWDSYPDGLGVKLLQEIKDAIKNIGVEKIKERFVKIELIKDGDNVIPPKEMIEKYNKYANTSVGGPIDNTEVKSWYQLLRNIQGTLMPYFEGDVEHMIDSLNFIEDSLFCEWAYIVNLDDELFEIYVGFQHNKHSEGRYADLKGYKSSSGDTYYPCKLIKTYPLSKLPSEKKFLTDIKKLTGDEE